MSHTKPRYKSDKDIKVFGNCKTSSHLQQAQEIGVIAEDI